MEKSINHLASLASMVRMEMLVFLAETGKPTTIQEIGNKFNLSPALTSYHLKSLKEEGFVQSEKEGLYVYYNLAPAVVLDKGTFTFNVIDDVQLTVKVCPPNKKYVYTSIKTIEIPSAPPEKGNKKEKEVKEEVSPVKGNKKPSAKK